MVNVPLSEIVKRTIIALIIVGAAGLMAWAISSTVTSAHSEALATAQTTLQHTQLVAANEQQELQEALLGECTGRNQVITLVDSAHEALHYAFAQIAALSYAAAKEYSGTKRTRTLEFAREYSTDAAAFKRITTTNCAQELLHPLTYPQSSAIPFPR